MQFFSKKQVAALIAVSVSTLDRMIADGDFPHGRTYHRPNRTGTVYWQRLYWLDEVVYNWMADQLKETLKNSLISAAGIG